ncbi:cellulase family glycosylhydrolase [candidate division KSB1 bacterium]|nr:cellulase family glycosylhydrolase [candidate division KSB1 bacterium]
MLLASSWLFSCDSQATSPSDENNEPVDVFEQNKLLYRCVNLGNALEAPTEGEWGVTLQHEYFELIRDAGFTGVRIPIRWSAHAAVDSPYTISKSFLSRVDWAVNLAEQNDLAAIINIHHYEEIMTEPEAHKERFLGLWRQIASHFQNRPSSIFFEVLNEPNDKLTAEIWNDYLAAAIDLIRQTNKNRTIIIGTAEWGHLNALNKLVLPEDDQNIIVTFHYYNPFHFTHQGAEWVSNSDQWLGTTWNGTASEKKAVDQDFESAVIWAAQHNRPLFMGEFGAYRKADMPSRYAWTSYVARAAEKRNISWAYWEFCSGFGIYDSSTKKWNSLLNALIPEE